MMLRYFLPFVEPNIISDGMTCQFQNKHQVKPNTCIQQSEDPMLKQEGPKGPRSLT